MSRRTVGNESRSGNLNASNITASSVSSTNLTTTGNTTFTGVVSTPAGEVDKAMQYSAEDSILRNLPSRVHPAETLLKQAVWWIDSAHSDSARQRVENLGWGGSVLDAQLGSANSGLRIEPQDGYVYLPGIIGNYLSVPDAAALDITGDIDIRVRVALDDWTPAATNNLLGKWATSNLSYIFGVATNGTLLLAWSANGTSALQKNSTVATGISDGAVKWVRATLDVDNGASGNDVKFYTSDDGATWTQLGSTVTTASTTSIYSGTGEVRVGDGGASSINPATGKVYRAQVFNGIDGTKVLDIDCSQAVIDRPQFTALTGQVVTINDTSRDSNDPKFLDWTGENYVYLPEASSNFLSVPDANNLDITGDIDVRVKVAMDDWTPASNGTVISKTVDGAGQRSWFLNLNSPGTLLFGWYEDGTTLISRTSSVATGIADGSVKWIRATLDVDNGSSGHDVKFFTSDDGVSWSQLGTTVTTAGTTSVFSGTSAVRLSQDFPAGKVYRAQVLNGIDGTPVLDIDCSAVASGAATSFTARTGQTVTINRSTSGRKAVAVVHPVWLLGTDDYLEVPARWVDASSGGLFLPGVAGNYASAPDSAALSITGDITIDVHANLNNWKSTNQGLVGKWQTPTASFVLEVQGDGTLTFYWSEDGAAVKSASSTAAVPMTGGGELWVRGCLDVNNGAGQYEVKFFTSTNGSSWTQLGSTRVGTTGPTSIYDSTLALTVGAYVSTGAAGPTAGAIYRARIYASADGSGSPVFDANFTGKTVATNSFTESSANAATVTINRSGSGYVATLVPSSGYVRATGVANFQPSSYSMLDFGASDSFTVLAVARRWASPANNGVLVSKQSSSTSDPNYLLRSNGTGFADQFQVQSSALDFAQPISATYSSGASNVVIAVADRASNQARVWTNGTGGTAASISSIGSLSNSLTLRVGARNGGTPSYAEMEFIAAAVFRRALTASEIATLSNYYQSRV